MTVKPSATSCSAASNVSTGSGSNVRSSACTSNLMRSVSSASLANCAVSTASAALRHPAVFGSSSMFNRRNNSSTPEPPSASARRMATVVNSVPEATSARSSTLRLLAPPVPMIRREVNLRSPMTSWSPSPAAGSRSILMAFESPSLHGGQDLHLGPVGDHGLGPPPTTDHLAVQRHGDPLDVLDGGGQHIGDRAAVGQLPLLPITEHSHQRASRS